MYALNSDYVVTHQKGEAYYDVETNQYFYKVFSEYITPQDTYGALVTLYSL